jgi:hypothetical protein
MAQPPTALPELAALMASLSEQSAFTVITAARAVFGEPSSAKLRRNTTAAVGSQTIGFIIAFLMAAGSIADAGEVSEKAREGERLAHAFFAKSVSLIAPPGRWHPNIHRWNRVRFTAALDGR